MSCVLIVSWIEIYMSRKYKEVFIHGLCISINWGFSVFCFIFFSKQITEAFQRQADLLSQATEEVEQFCDDHSWVAVIHEFVSSWGSGDTHKLRGQQTSKIEVWFHHHHHLFYLPYNKNLFTAVIARRRGNRTSRQFLQLKFLSSP